MGSSVILTSDSSKQPSPFIFIFASVFDLALSICTGLMHI